MSHPNPTTTPVQTPVGQGEIDPATLAELDAIDVATRAMTGLNKDGRTRVVRYLTDRFGLNPTSVFPNYRH